MLVFHSSVISIICQSLQLITVNNIMTDACMFTLAGSPGSRLSMDEIVSKACEEVHMYRIHKLVSLTVGLFFCALFVPIVVRSRCKLEIQSYPEHDATSKSSVQLLLRQFDHSRYTYVMTRHSMQSDRKRHA